MRIQDLRSKMMECSYREYRGKPVFTYFKIVLKLGSALHNIRNS
jgi:hypothetical protein